MYADRVNASSPILASLNASQKAAVLHESGPLLILAGAGSGKTRTITHRMAYWIEEGCPPESFLAITFTNKAAGEMQARMEKLTGRRSPWISTFHSYCARLLRRHIHRLEPYDNSFTIYDAEDSRELIKDLTEELAIDRSLWSARAAQEEISRIKNTACGHVDEGRGSTFAHGKALRSIFAAYTEALRNRNAVDFDDLLLLTVRLLEECPDILQRYQEQFRHVLIDEYQDTNALQYRIGRLLTSSHRNICITGDPDQSVYGWRGADISNILNFEQDYPDAKVVLLEQNYRSTQHILDVANALITHNTLRKPKALWTEKGAGEPVRAYRFSNETEEASEVASLLRELIDSGTPLGSIAIFYRINALSRALEQSLIYQGIPYSIVGGITYFLRKEVKDILAYLRILDNRRDEESLKRILNVPTRGIGKASMEKLVREARTKGVPLLDLIVSGQGNDIVGRKALGGLERFVHLYSSLAEMKKGTVSDLVSGVIETTAYIAYLRESRGDGAREDIENVWQLVSAASEFDKDNPEGTLTGFLEVVNLLGDVDRWQRSEDRVTLMTLHSAKGLEFPVVVIVGVEDGILPLINMESEDTDMEEERRLLYVGLTRAQEQLFLTHVGCRMRFGATRAAYPSRFLRELRPKDTRLKPTSVEGALELDRETEESLAFLDEPHGTRWGGGPRAAELDEEALSFGDDVFDGEDPYPVGCRVRHADYGEGDVVRVSGIGTKQRITVDFADAGEKQFAVGFAKLKRLR